MNLGLFSDADPAAIREKVQARIGHLDFLSAVCNDLLDDGFTRIEGGRPAATFPDDGCTRLKRGRLAATLLDGGFTRIEGGGRPAATLLDGGFTRIEGGRPAATLLDGGFTRIEGGRPVTDSPEKLEVGIPVFAKNLLVTTFQPM